MRVLSPIAENTRLAMIDRGQNLAVRDLVAAELVGDGHPRHTTQALEWPAEESPGGVAISSGLDQYIENVAVLVDRAQTMLPTDDSNENLAEAPIAIGPGQPGACVCLPEVGSTAGSSRN